MTAASKTTGWIRFDAVEIDGDGHRLLVDGVEVALERKAFAVLVMLAGDPGRLFTRDEILETVWGHSHVTPGVLNRVVTLLRQALGESAGDHRYLHTVHGVGYRFDAVVQSETVRKSLAEPTEAPQRRASDPASTTRDQDSPEGAAAGTRDRAQAGPAGHFRRRRNVLALALGTLVLAAALVFLLGRGDDLDKTPIARAQPALVVLPLRPVGGEHDERALADGLSEELITRLSRIDGLHLISSTSATRAQIEGFDLRQLAERLQVTYALEGSLRQSGQRLRIDLRLLELPGGRAMWAQDFDREMSDVFAIQREIAQSVANALTLRLGLQGDHRIEADAQSFRAYLEARRLMRLTKDTQHARAAADQILRANLSRNSADSRSRGLLALLLSLRDFSPTDDSARHLPGIARNLEEARNEATAALAVDPDLVDAHEALANVACDAADWQGCMERYRRALGLDPTNYALRSRYAARLGSLGYLDEALRETEIGLASEPLSYEPSFQRGRLLDTLGRHDEARGALERAGELWPEQPWRVNYARWFNAVWRKDLAPTRQLAELLPDSDPYRASYIAASMALLDPTQWPQVRALIIESERATGNLNFLHVLLPHVDAAHVVNGFEQALRDAFPSYYLFLWQPEYAQLRADPEFADLLRRLGIIAYWNANGWPRQCHPLGDSVACD